MADNRFMNTSAAEATQVDLGLRSYMLGVYNPHDDRAFDDRFLRHGA